MKHISAYKQDKNRTSNREKSREKKPFLTNLTRIARRGHIRHRRRRRDRFTVQYLCRLVHSVFTYCYRLIATCCSKQRSCSGIRVLRSTRCLILIRCCTCRQRCCCRRFKQPTCLLHRLFSHFNGTSLSSSCKTNIQL